MARAGRRVATGEARLIQSGEEIVRVGATFGHLAEHFWPHGHWDSTGALVAQSRQLALLTA